jgi:hypothetical protein
MMLYLLIIKIIKMDSKITETQMIDSPRSIVIPFDMEGLNESNMCDLNKVFQINFSYNIELLKNLLEGILKFQKSTEEEIESLKEDNREKNLKIKKLESKLSGTGTGFMNEKHKEENMKRRKSIIVDNKGSLKFGQITYPVDENNILEPSDENSEIVNKIIVSYSLFINA